MSDSIKLSITLPVKPKKIYEAWLNSEKHSALSGGSAKIERKVGSNYSAWDGYITGQNILLHLNKRIVQSWRTTEFPEDSPDSQIEILLDNYKEGTKFTILHSNLPEGDGKKYRKGWKEHYFTPMKSYFKEKQG